MSGNGLGGGLFVDAMGGWGGAALINQLIIITSSGFDIDVFSMFGYRDFILFFL